MTAVATKIYDGSSYQALTNGLLAEARRQVDENPSSEIDHAKIEEVARFALSHLSAAVLPEEGDVGITREGPFTIDASLNLKERNIAVRAHEVCSSEGVELRANQVTMIAQTPLCYLGSLFADYSLLFSVGVPSSIGSIGGSCSLCLCPPKNLTWQLAAFAQPQLVRVAEQSFTKPAQLLS